MRTATPKPDDTVRGVRSSLCLDVTDGATANGAQLQRWTCSASANQR